jgi:hypothetical protein
MGRKGMNPMRFISHCTIRIWLALATLQIQIGIVAGLSLTASTTLAVEQDTIDRTIVAEPTYQSAAPRYVLLLFGPQSKRVWVVLDGDTVYIDRKSDGDLTSKKNRFEKATDGRMISVEIPDADGKTSYVISNVERLANEIPTAGCACIHVMIFGTVTYKQYSVVDLANSPQTATLAHFNGPLTIGPATVESKPDSSLKLHTGNGSAELRAMVGTFSPYGRPVVVVSEDMGRDQFRGYLPMVDIEFPAKAAGDSPVRQRYLLDETCCGSLFKGQVQAPPEAGPGMAHVTFSFNMWKEGHVAPSTAEIPVLTAEQAKQQRQLTSH